MSSRTRLSIGLCVIVVAAGLIFAAANKVAPLSWELWGPINQDDGLALKGYDAVIYHTKGEAKPGSAAISTAWDGVEWGFATTENKTLFESSPAAYAPQYGGFCATAVADDLTADIDPEIWHRTEGRLYLFNNQDAKDSWVAELGQGVINRGDHNWENR